MKEEYLLKIKKELSKYQNIPRDLCDYIKHATRKDAQEHLLIAITKEKEQKIILQRTDNLFKKASEITRLSPLEILKALDFHSKDVSLGRIDAAFAELRTIIFLSNLNLYNIIPLKAEHKKKSADFIANGNSHKYAIEVFCKISKELKEEFKTIEVNLKPLTIESDLFQHYISKAEEKKPQLDNTLKKYSCDKNIMVMVLNDPNIWGLLVFHEYVGILKKISIELDWGSKYHFAIVTGVTTLGIDKVEDVIYPSIL